MAIVLQNGEIYKLKEIYPHHLQLSVDISTNYT